MQTSRTRRSAALGLPVIAALVLAQSRGSGPSAEPDGSDTAAPAPASVSPGTTVAPGEPTADATDEEGPGRSRGSAQEGPDAASIPGVEVSDGEIVDPGPDGPAMPEPGPRQQQTEVLDDLDGTAEQSCVDVAGLRDVRSGGFAAGPFDTVREQFEDEYGEGRQVRLYLVPQHAAEMDGVVVTAVEQASGAELEVSQDQVADAEEFLFYDVQIDLPRAGTWRVRATAGRDRGCWVVKL